MLSEARLIIDDGVSQFVAELNDLVKTLQFFFVLCPVTRIVASHYFKQNILFHLKGEEIPSSYSFEEELSLLLVYRAEVVSYNQRDIPFYHSH